MQLSIMINTGVSVQEVQPVPSWGGFNSISYPDLLFIREIGYCPVIEGHRQLNYAQFTVLKHAQKIWASLGQRDTIITFDLAIYVAKANSGE